MVDSQCAVPDALNRRSTGLPKSDPGRASLRATRSLGSGGPFLCCRGEQLQMLLGADSQVAKLRGLEGAVLGANFQVAKLTERRGPVCQANGASTRF